MAISYYSEPGLFTGKFGVKKNDEGIHQSYVFDINCDKRCHCRYVYVSIVIVNCKCIFFRLMNW